ncbi:MAG: TIGR04053 family radical SAM/SPASM domain-containing protein [Candidatus Wallbacteria bacterium]|nr:TIGR04053 family radical SAM/SPASM domain-containing protein [Candidatus Wallbacteria bacterium]
MPEGRLDFDERPILVFWESTRACMPAPILIVTGGDAMMRPDVFELVGYARERGIPVGLSPSVTPLLTLENARRMRELGVKAASISLDGAQTRTHESIRGVSGHFPKTLEALRMMVSLGYTLQVNTTVMRDNVEELADLACLLKEIGVKIWEVFFLIQVGRGSEVRELTPEEHEEVCHFLYDVSRHGITVRTVEAPFFRRVCTWRLADGPGEDPIAKYGLSRLYGRLRRRLEEKMGAGGADPLIRSARTRDGKGIVFVGYNGDIYPAGFLPVALGNIRRDGLVETYRNSELLKQIRSSAFTGRCGNCEYADLCGGSRARAYARFGDPLGEDPACAYQPRNANPQTASI